MGVLNSWEKIIDKVRAQHFNSAELLRNAVEATREIRKGARPRQVQPRGKVSRGKAVGRVNDAANGFERKPAEE